MHKIIQVDSQERKRTRLFDTNIRKFNGDEEVIVLDDHSQKDSAQKLDQPKPDSICDQVSCTTASGSLNLKHRSGVSTKIEECPQSGQSVSRHTFHPSEIPVTSKDLTKAPSLADAISFDQSEKASVPKVAQETSAIVDLGRESVEQRSEVDSSDDGKKCPSEFILNFPLSFSTHTLCLSTNSEAVLKRPLLISCNTGELMYNWPVKKMPSFGIGSVKAKAPDFHKTAKH